MGFGQQAFCPESTTPPSFLFFFWTKVIPIVYTIHGYFDLHITILYVKKTSADISPTMSKLQFTVGWLQGYQNISEKAVRNTSVLVFCISGAIPTRSRISRHFLASFFASLSKGSAEGGRPVWLGDSGSACWHRMRAMRSFFFANN